MSIIKKISFLFFIILLFFQLFIPKSLAADTIIRSFSNSTTDGRVPCAAECKLVQAGSVFYGMTEGGGSAGSGTLFKINTDGTGFTILKSFAGGVGDGYAPLGYPTIDGSVIYGMTYGGGLADWGVIFKINTNGTGFTVLHEFSGGLGDGASPRGSLTQIGSTLYGMTSGGGDFAAGTIFKINTDGTGFSTLHEFTGDVDDGSQPYGNLLLNGSTFYGVTSRGGDGDIGTIFKINTDGTGFNLLREFSGGANDGSFPYGSLIYYSGKLYGLTQQGGNSNLGVIFQINTDGTGFSALHKFTGTPGDGSSPDGSLTEYNGILYGFGFDGGTSDFGTLFSYNVASTTYTTLHSFTGAPGDGQNSSGTLTFDTSTSRLYGMTNYGGTDDKGTIFYYQTSEPTPSPTSAPSSTSTPTPTTSSNTSNNSGSGQTTSSSPSNSNTCNSQEPSSAPNLFQIDTNNSTATLYFAPAGKPYNSYYINYGNGSSNQEYGTSFYQGESSGAIKFTVSNLKSNSSYTFKVRGANGCSAGPWSKNISIKTSSFKYLYKHFYTSSLIDYTIGYTIPNIIQSFKKLPVIQNNNSPKQEKMKSVSKTPTPEAKSKINKEVKKTNQSLWSKILNLF